MKYARDQKILNYISRLYVNDFCGYKQLLETETEEDTDNIYTRKTFIYKATQLIREYELDFSTIIREGPMAVPDWKAQIQICEDLFSLQKNKTLDSHLRASYYDHIYSKFHPNKIYTDGSKSNLGVGYSVVSKDAIISARIPNDCTIFTAELTAIKEAMKYGISENLEYLTICTDSRSAIEALKRTNPKNPIAKDVRAFTNFFPYGIKVCWVPSHIGINANEIADKEAKRAVENLEFATQSIPRSDFKSIIKRKVYAKWKQEWEQVQNNKYRSIAVKPGPLPCAYSGNRQWERTLARLRMGHSHLTHGHLMSRDAPPECDHCGDQLTIKHVLSECDNLSHLRYIYFNQRYPSMNDILNDPQNVFEGRLYKFLKRTNFYEKI